MSPILLARIASLLQVPIVPDDANVLCLRRISFEVLEQSKALPLHSVVPPPAMLHVNVSTSPGQAQLTLSGTCNVSFPISIILM